MNNANNVYEFGSFDKFGHLNSSYFVMMNIFIIIVAYLISIAIINYKYFTFDFEIIIKNYITYFKNIYYFYESKGILTYLVKEYKYFILPLLLVVLYVYNVFNLKSEQRKLANYGLEDYYLYKKLKNGVIYKILPSAIMDYEKFTKQFENILQRNNKGSCEISRVDKTSIKIIYKNKIPTIEQLKDYKIQDYLKKDKLFLGFEGGLIKNIEPIYIDFKDLPHSFALLGTSGGGKSNSLNHILFSIFYNFNNVYELNFVDFKGGIESEPYNRLEQKYKTNKINTYNSSRFELYKKLVQLDIINKARQQYLKDKGLKKFKTNFIYLFLDEIAEILDYSPSDKIEKEQHNKVKDIIESLFRTGRSQGFKIFFATQIFTSVGSGISNSIKNNTIFRILHKTESDEGIHSVIDKEPLEERGINPKTFGVGEVVIKNENLYYHCRSLYVPDDFINYIQLPKTKIDVNFENEINKYINIILKDYKLNDLTKDDLFPNLKT